eukprot:CAMPEP_0178430556 /NCGR_PEP_ID=MMETSP0689_2-20121128/31382_1 /TAXON_ID=160604 /ORGANISM="Amphidinium massartii, Strain CS-259" /LENGTH=71 /DNA_ID=CAMNT_0020052419 /DNA_START=135 /DNA_END=350 /DNA_ORIENTATION=+
MGLQEELSKGGKESRVIQPGETGEDNFVQQAADSLDSAFGSFEAAVSQGMEALFGSSESVAQPATSSTKQA